MKLFCFLCVAFLYRQREQSSSTELIMLHFMGDFTRRSQGRYPSITKSACCLPGKTQLWYHLLQSITFHLNQFLYFLDLSLLFEMDEHLPENHQTPKGLFHEAALMSQACSPNVFSHYCVKVKALGDIFHKDAGTNSCSPGTESRAQDIESGTVSTTETGKD